MGDPLYYPPAMASEREEAPPSIHSAACTCGVDELMAISGMSRQQVAVALGTNKMTVGRWLTGDVPHVAARERIAALIQEWTRLAIDNPGEFDNRLNANIYGG